MRSPRVGHDWATPLSSPLEYTVGRYYGVAVTVITEIK